MKIIIFLFLVFFLVALGHDLYLNFYLDEENLMALTGLQYDYETFIMSDLGWIMQSYTPDILTFIQDSLSNETRIEYLEPVLALPAVVITGVLLLIGILIGFLIYLVKEQPWQEWSWRKRSPGEDQSTFNHARKKAYKYTRK